MNAIVTAFYPALLSNAEAAEDAQRTQRIRGAVMTLVLCGLCELSAASALRGHSFDVGGTAG